MTTHTPQVSPGMQETIARLYELSGSKVSQSDFMAKLFAPIPMEAELGAAGLSPQEARFIAGQLARNGYTIIKVDVTEAMVERAYAAWLKDTHAEDWEIDEIKSLLRSVLLAALQQAPE